MLKVCLQRFIDKTFHHFSVDTWLFVVTHWQLFSTSGISGSGNASFKLSGLSSSCFFGCSGTKWQTGLHQHKMFGEQHIEFRFIMTDSGAESIVYFFLSPCSFFLMFLFFSFVLQDSHWKCFHHQKWASCNKRFSVPALWVLFMISCSCTVDPQNNHGKITCNSPVNTSVSESVSLKI